MEQPGRQMALTARSPRLQLGSLAHMRPLTGRGFLLMGKSQCQLATYAHDALAGRHSSVFWPETCLRHATASADAG